MLLHMTLTDQEVYKASPNAIITPTEVTDNSSVPFSAQSLFQCPWLSRHPPQGPCVSQWEGELEGVSGREREGRRWLGPRGTGPHELPFGLLQEQMWYLGLAV